MSQDTIDTFAIERFEAQEGMRKFGGSFTRALGEALAFADLDNARKIKVNWRRDWNHHRELYIKYCERVKIDKNKKSCVI